MKIVVEINPDSLNKLLGRYRRMFFYGNIMNRDDFTELMDDDQRKAYEKLLKWASDAHRELFTLGIKMEMGEEK